MRLFAACLIAGIAAMTAGTINAEEKGVLNHTMKTLNGKEVNLAEKYHGKVLLIVNVASQCGATPQYAQLEGLQEKYKGKGLEVVGFPCNQFGGQEPGEEKEIKVCQAKYKVSFDTFAKIDVNGDDAAPIYKQLTAKEGKIKWNFEKFVIGRNGEIVARFPTSTQPDDPKVVEAIETELAKPAK